MKKGLVLGLLLIAFNGCVSGRVKKDGCFVRVPDLRKHDLLGIAYGQKKGFEINFDYEKNRVFILGDDWPKLWAMGGSQVLMVGDTLLEADGCTLQSIAVKSRSHVDVSPYVSDGYLSKIDLLLLGSKAEIEKHIKEVEIIRAGEKHIIRIGGL